MQRFGLTWADTGNLKLWQFAALVDEAAREQREQAESQKAAQRFQTRQDGTQRVPI